MEQAETVLNRLTRPALGTGIAGRVWNELRSPETNSYSHRRVLEQKSVFRFTLSSSSGFPFCSTDNGTRWGI